MLKVAVLPEDGIGSEVMPPAQAVLERAGSMFGFSLQWEEFAWGCEYYLADGRMLPDDGLARLAAFDAIFLGAVGAPGVPDHVSLWGLLIPIRREFHQSINLRPIKLLRGITSPLRSTGDGIDFLVVRENNEGEYSEIGGRLNRGTPHEMALQESVFTRIAAPRSLRSANLDPERAIEDVLGDGETLTPDLGGRANTDSVGAAILGTLEDHRPG